VADNHAKYTEDHKKDTLERFRTWLGEVRPGDHFWIEEQITKLRGLMSHLEKKEIRGAAGFTPKDVVMKAIEADIWDAKMKAAFKKVFDSLSDEEKAGLQALGVTDQPSNITELKAALAYLEENDEPKRQEFFKALANDKDLEKVLNVALERKGIRDAREAAIKAIEDFFEKLGAEPKIATDQHFDEMFELKKRAKAIGSIWSLDGHHSPREYELALKGGELRSVLFSMPRFARGSDYARPRFDHGYGDLEKEVEKVTDPQKKRELEDLLDQLQKLRASFMQLRDLNDEEGEIEIVKGRDGNPVLGVSRAKTSEQRRVLRGQFDDVREEITESLLNAQGNTGMEKARQKSDLIDAFDRMGSAVVSREFGISFGEARDNYDDDQWDARGGRNEGFAYGNNFTWRTTMRPISNLKGLSGVIRSWVRIFLQPGSTRATSRPTT